MYLTGFADEAAGNLDGQIKATKELGWQNIEARNIDGQNIHDLPQEQFDAVCGKLEETGININCFGSTIANWAKRIDEPFDSSIAEAKRAIPRMKRLGTKLIRIMSFAVLDGHGPDDQMAEERFSRLRELQKMFADEGLTPVHENCMNYGGMGWSYTLKLIENVPGLKLVFDTGNAIAMADRMKPEPCSMQSSWDFYSHVRDEIVYVHIKDGIWHDDKQEAEYVFPGEGHGDVRRIMEDIMDNGYDGGISIEPHMKVVFHDASVQSDSDAQYKNYVEYGRRMAAMLRELKEKR